MFQLQPGDILATDYLVVRLLGSGWEGEVYEVEEKRTKVRRAAKLFFPRRNVRDKAVRYQARKLERLRRCQMVIQYMHSETVVLGGQRVTCLISELVEGELLTDLVKRQRGGRFTVFEALCLLHTIATGLEEIHDVGEYHGDLHSSNVLVNRRGIRFDVKLLDFYPRGRTSALVRADDVVDAVRLFYDAVGGKARYAGQPAIVKRICLGMRAPNIRRRFPSARALRLFVEQFEWSD